MKRYKRAFSTLGFVLNAVVLMPLPALSFEDDRAIEDRVEGLREQPNIVVIMTDDQRMDEPQLAMPKTLSLIAEQGTVFSNAIAHSPLCAPSRATFLTGQYAHNHRVLSNHSPEGGYTKLDHSNTLPVWLQEAGYHTILVDKYLNEYGIDSDPYEVPPGWSDWRAAISLSYFNYTVNVNGKLREYGAKPEEYRTDVMAAHAVEAIEKAPQDQPFFMWFATIAPHVDVNDCCDSPTPAPRHDGAFSDWKPNGVPPSFNEKDVSDKPTYISEQNRLKKDHRKELLRKEQKRLESLLAVDDLVERVINAVAARGELEKTLFVFTSDHAYMMGEHRIDGFHKKVPYEESIRVPLFVRGPWVQQGATLTHFVSNQDMAGTIAAFAGATPGLEVDGLDLWTITPDRSVYLYNSGKKGPPGYDGVRTSKWVYLNYETGEQELYDLEQDPDQMESRHADPAYANIKASLHEVLEGLRACKGAECQMYPHP